MWPFTKKPKTPEHVWGPMEGLFATYVLDVIGHLPADKQAAMAALGPQLRQTLKTNASDWKGILVESLHLSETIDYAIQDLWHTNSDKAQAEGTSISPKTFAEAFVVEYKRDGSQIDVWTDDTLARAKARIATRRR
jgi:hypothetical protein